jgi:hypothetical protein
MRGQPPFITGIVTVPLRIPFKADTKSDASAWGDSNLPAADSLLVKVTTDQGAGGVGRGLRDSGIRFRQPCYRPTDRTALRRPGCNADRIANAGRSEEAARSTTEVRLANSWASYARNHHMDNFSNRLAPAPILKSDGQTGE